VADSYFSALRNALRRSEESVSLSSSSAIRRLIGGELRVVSRGRMFPNASVIGLRGGAAGSSALTGRRSRRQLRRGLSSRSVVTEASGRHNHRKACNSQNRFLHSVSHCLLGQPPPCSFFPRTKLKARFAFRMISCRCRATASAFEPERQRGLFIFLTRYVCESCALDASASPSNRYKLTDQPVARTASANIFRV